MKNTAGVLFVLYTYESFDGKLNCNYRAFKSCDQTSRVRVYTDCVSNARD